MGSKLHLNSKGSILFKLPGKFDTELLGLEIRT